jgi:hypothetical protein
LGEIPHVKVVFVAKSMSNLYTLQAETGVKAQGPSTAKGEEKTIISPP